MDLGFARRLRKATGRLQASPQLSRLLAELSARQAVSPTALAQIHATPKEESTIAGHPEIAQFAPKDAQEAASSSAASFNAGVAEAVLTQSKSL